MPSKDRDTPNNDRELVRHRPTPSDSSRSLVPMWDSSDPERAPPPLPLNPRSMSPATRHGVSPNIQAVAAKFTDKPSENTLSSYTTNPMPNKAGSPERSLVKGHHHKRMQSLPPSDTKGDARSDFLNYLENRSPERPLRATIIDPTNMPLDTSKVYGSPPRPAEREIPSYVSGHYLSKPILGESTPPSATMLALQNMQLPSDNDPPPPSKPPKMIAAAKVEEPRHTMDTLASQICSLTDIASNLQREMSNLSRRSKDNATDLVSLKAATNARDEDIRKSLKDLSSNLTSKYFDGDLSRLDLSAFLKPESGPNPTESDSSPNSKRSYSVPRMPSPNPFAFDRDVCGSPAPISDGSASIALLEKVLREMATKEGEERLLELVDEIKSRPATTPSDKDADKKITNMLEEILNLVKEDPSSRALVRSMTTENLRPPTNANNGGLRSTSLGSIDETATVRALDVPKDDKLQRNEPNNDEVLAILRTVRSSVVEGGGMTNNVKALVRELRGEVLGMGRDLARKLEAVEWSIAHETQQQPQIEAPSADQISTIIRESLGDLQEQLAATVNESRSQASAFSQFQSTMNSAEIYSIVKRALDELEFPQPQKDPDGSRLEKDDILDTVRDAWETYKPEIELQTIGLERDEILECLAEGLKSYQPQHEQAITYDQVVAAVQTGLQNFTPPPVEQPPAITRDEIILTIRECLEKPEDTSRALEDNHANNLISMRDEILQAVSERLEPHSRGLEEEHVNFFHSIRDELLHAVAERPESTSRSLHEDHLHHLGSIRDEILQAMSQRPESTTRSLDDEHIQYLNSMREELLQAIAERPDSTDRALDEDHNNHLTSIRDEILQAISERSKSNRLLDDEHIHYLNSIRDDILHAMSERPESAPRSLDDEQIHYLNSIRDDILHAMTEKSIEAAESTAPRSINEEQFEHLNSLRDEILDAVTRSMTTQSMVSKESFDSGLGRDDIVSAISDGLEAHFTSAKELDEQRVSREDVVNAINDAFNAQQSALTTSPQPAISREEIMDAIVDGIEIANQAKETAISTNVQPSSSISREEILEAISEGLERTYESQKSALSTEVQQPSITREEVFTAIMDGFENANTMTREIELNKDDLMEAITTGLHEATNSANINVGDQVLERLQDVVDGMKEEFKQYSAANGKDTEQVLDAVKDGLAVVRQEIELYVATAQEVSGKHEIIDTVKEGFRLLQADMEKTITDTAASNANPSTPDTAELLDAMEKEFEHLRTSMSNLLLDSHRASDKDEILDAIRDASEQQRNKLAEEQILSSIKEEFEKMRESTAMSVVPSEPPSSEKEDIIAALREHFDVLREETMQQNTKSADEQILNSIKEELEKIRESTAISVVASEPPPSEKEDIIAAIREHFDALREETMQRKDAGESMGSANSELLDAFNDGILLIRDDVQKVLDKPADFDSSEILTTIKDGMAELRLEIDSLRQSQKEEDSATDVVETARGGEVVLANEPSALGTDIEGLKTLITQLTDKMESIETTRAAEPVEEPTAEPAEPALNRGHLDEVLMALQEVQLAIGETRPTEPAEPAEPPLNRSHLDEVMMALQEVQLAVGEMSASREIPEGGARKEDTDTIEGLIMGTKAQIEEIQFPSLDGVATSEHIGALEAMIRESKDAIADLSTRLEAEGSTKSDIGTLEGLIKDIWVALEELKGKTKEEEETEGDEGEDNGKLLKSDLQTVEAMIFEVKTQIDELKLPDVETLPTKEEIQELSALVTDFRDKMENANDLAAQGFEARKTEHGGLAIKIDEKIDEAKFVVGELGDELKSKLDGSSEGLMELKQLLEGLAISAENFTTVENVKELTDLINREFERARGEEDAGRLEKEERDAAALIKHDETRAAVIVELGAKIDEKIGEVIAKYEEAHNSLHSKFSETEERDLAHAETMTSTKSLAEDIRLVIGAMATTVTEACERTTEETKALAEKVDESYNRMEEMHNEAKSHQEQSRGENERVVAATERVESKLLEFNPQILETVQQILNVVSQHFDHSQKSAEEVKSELMSLPAAIPSMLPALPPPESSREIEDDPVHNKLNDLLEHAKNSPVQDVLNMLLEHSKSTQLHDKLDRALEHGAASNSDIYEKLNQILDHTTNGTGSIHEKLDALLSRPVNTVDPDHSVTQMMKLDEMHKDIMENTRKMNEMFAVQSTLVAEETERKRREAEEAAIALERRIAQREQVEADIVGLQEEKESLLKMFQTLKAEKDELAKQTSKMSKELSGLETALEIRHEEMQQMEERADGLEKRILEGVLDHARSILLSRSGSLNSMNLKRNQSTRSSRAGARSPSMASVTTTSTAREPKDARSLLGNGVGMALKRRTGNGPQSGPKPVQPNIGKERRILSLSHVTGNRDAGRQSGPSGGITSLKRSHSVKSNFSARKTSWAGPTANKENETFPEEEEPESEPETDAGTERKTSYAGSNRQSSYAGTERKVSYAETCTDSVITGVTESVISEDRRTSGMTSATGEHEESELASDDDEDDAQTVREDDDEDVDSDGEDEESEEQQDDVDDSLSDTASAMEAEVLKLLEAPPDSGLGTEMTVS
ncbi:hypothetical protein N7486_008296 [Penicillium sp. IBT 16267x]|nr:hypothetical protein N7486_008296 [Penicillium sp. IBT 16267x]